jgi:hypothetical protein
VTDLCHVVIVWADDSQEPLKATVEACYPDNGFLILELGADLLAKNVKSRMLMFPASAVASVELEEREEAHPGYRESSTFRESPENSRWFGGMGQGNGGEKKA